MLTVSQLFIYPVKSLGGIPLTSAETTERGFKYDRRWLLVDDQNQFMTQRDFPQMSLLQPTILPSGLHIAHKQKHSEILIPFYSKGNELTVQIWRDHCRARLVSDEANEWFSEMLSVRCKLVYMPDETRRLVEAPYAKNNEITSFSDAYPFLIIGQATLDDLNQKLKQSVPVNRFRPNIVFTGGQAFEEDQMQHFTINHINFYGVKPCARCVITTVNQDTATKGKEPLQTLSTYRLKNNKVFFGQNLLHKGEGSIHVGDEIVVKETVAVVSFP